MDTEIKRKLEKLKKENKAKIAKKQLIDDLNDRYHIDISSKDFIDYELSEIIYKKVYERIREEDIIIQKFYYEYDVTNKELEEIFTIFKHYESNDILFYPSPFEFDFRSCNQLYLDFPIAIISTIKDCRDIIFKLIYETKNDLIIIDKSLKYGFVISKDEYQYLSIEHWGA